MSGAHDLEDVIGLCQWPRSRRMGGSTASGQFDVVGHLITTPSRWGRQLYLSLDHSGYECDRQASYIHQGEHPDSDESNSFYSQKCLRENSELNYGV